MNGYEFTWRNAAGQECLARSRGQDALSAWGALALWARDLPDFSAVSWEQVD